MAKNRDMEVLVIPVEGNPKFVNINSDLTHLSNLIALPSTFEYLEHRIELIGFSFNDRNYKMVVHEEGRCINLPLNPRACHLFNKIACIQNLQVGPAIVVGDVLVCAGKTYLKSVHTQDKNSFMDLINDVEVFDKWWNNGGKKMTEQAMRSPMFMTYSW